MIYFSWKQIARISPAPLRGEVNEIANIKYIINKVAEIRQSSYEEIEQITSENTKRLFKKLKLI